MSTALAKAAPVAISLDALTAEQKLVIRNTCAPRDVSEDEFKLFLHVAHTSGLDPLRRQIHCMKLQGRLTIVADVNGLQDRADQFPDFRGIRFGVVHEGEEFVFDYSKGEVESHKSNPFKSGKPIGAWCIVTREARQPYVALVKFAEYDNPNNALWKSKPDVMILKCAKSTALRLAFPSAFSGIYDEAELGKEEVEVNPAPPKTEDDRARGKVTQDLKAALLAKAAQVTTFTKPEPSSTAPATATVEAPPTATAPVAPAVSSATPTPPVSPAPGFVIVDMAPGETEEQAVARAKQPTPYEKLIELGRLFNKTEKETCILYRRVTGKPLKARPEVTDAEVRQVQAELDGPGEAVQP